MPVRLGTDGQKNPESATKLGGRAALLCHVLPYSRAIESFDLLAILGCERQGRCAGFSSFWARHNEALPFGLIDTVRRRPLRDNSYAAVRVP